MNTTTRYPNKQEVDLTNCDKEPIHLIGKIQPHGFLLIFDESSLKIEQGSENVIDYLDVGIEDLLGKSLQYLLPKEQAAIEDQIKKQHTLSPQLLHIEEKPFFAFIHKSSSKIILECEPYQSLPEKDVIKSGSRLSFIQAQLNELDSLNEISGLITESIRSILDFDKVFVLKFDQDYNAEVIAEKLKPGVHSFLGHHFPASDIPAPARALLEVKHIRHIPNVSAQPAALIPYLNPSNGKPTDLLQSELRYPSEIHLEYMRNMNTSASVSFSVMAKGKLWGLISCNNEKPAYVDFHKRQLCEQMVKAYANILPGVKEKRDHQQYQHYKQVEKSLIKQLVDRQDLVKGLLEEELNLLGITESAGAAILIDKQVFTLGKTPDDAQIAEIADWLSRNNEETVFQTRELSIYLEDAVNYQEKACGLLALEISRFNKEYIFYFKPEIKEKKIWAGKPEKSVAGENLRIHPRKSFEKWEETIKGKSYPWNINELEIAQILLKDIVAVRLRNQNKILGELNEEYLVAANNLEIRNKQLEDFTRIITHNLRSPLANIQGLYTIYKDNPARLTADFFITQIKQATENMLVTIDDLNIVLRTNTRTHLETETVNISALIKKELQNLDATIINTGAEVKIQLQAPEVNTHKVYLESILHNLLSNALKYTSPERKPMVEVRSWLKKNKFYLSVSDNGIGIDLERYGHKIFGIYQTFHQHTDSRGVGLYLTKMQVESLGGNIEVKSEAGKGTTFTIEFRIPAQFPKP